MKKRNNNAQQYVKKGLISQTDLEFLVELDPSPNQKYLPFIIKSYLADTDLDLLRSRVEEYNTIQSRSKVIIKDISLFRTFPQFDEYVQKLNNISSTKELKREIKKDAEIVLDSADIFIVCPYSYPASRLYAGNTKWCITMANSVHFQKYFYEQFVTFYFVQVRSEDIKRSLNPDLWKVAVVVYRDGRLEIYDSVDHQVAGINIRLQKFVPPDELFKALHIDGSIFIPRGMDERMADVLSYMQDDEARELDISGANITKVPDEVGDMVQLETLTLSENKIESLPETIGLLTNLKTLFLFHNRLQSLPQSLNELRQLQWLGLTGNNMLSNKSIREIRRKLPNTRIYFD